VLLLKLNGFDKWPLTEIVADAPVNMFVMRFTSLLRKLRCFSVLTTAEWEMESKTFSKSRNVIRGRENGEMELRSQY
jgi:hypothetical protein